VVTADNVLDPEILRWALDKSNELTERWGLETGGYVGSVTSLASMFEDNFGDLPKTAEQAETYLGMMSKPMWINLVREDRTALHITIINSSGDNVPIQQTMDIMDEVFVNSPPGSTITLTGLSIVAPKAADLLDDTRRTILIYGVGFIMIGLLIAFRLNIRRVIAAAFPVLLVLGWGALFMYMSGIYISTLMALLPAQMIAIGVEFTILLLMRYYEERDKGEDPILAMNTAVTRIGRAILVSGAMVVLGFGILMLAFKFPSIQDFGLVTVIDMVLILTSTLIVLPAVVLTFDMKFRKGKIKTKAPGAVTTIAE
jgi:predicted RND superfamily exporter protein